MNRASWLTILGTIARERLVASVAAAADLARRLNVIPGFGHHWALASGVAAQTVRIRNRFAA